VRQPALAVATEHFTLDIYARTVWRVSMRALPRPVCRNGVCMPENHDPRLRKEKLPPTYLALSASFPSFEFPSLPPLRQPYRDESALVHSLALRLPALSSARDERRQRHQSRASALRITSPHARLCKIR